MNNPYYSAEHPDELLNQHMTKQSITGSRQAAEDAAIGAMFEALDSGKSRQEAEAIFKRSIQKSPALTGPYL